MNIGAKLLIWLVGIVIAFCLVFDIVMAVNDHDYTITVRNKERITKDDTSYYLIFAEKENGDLIELRVEDILWRGFFRSSSVYNEIEIGKEYEVEVVGFRNGFLSEYENILNIEEIEKEDVTAESKEENK
jgi:hypothetical protein